MMKKNSNFYFGALAATALLAACATDDGLTDGNYDQQRGVVKTEFTISFPAKAVGGTRMTEATVQGQATPVFRGIQDIKLYPFKTKANGVTTSTAIPGVITLNAGTAVETYGASATTNNVIASSGALFTGNNAHLYKDIEIEIGTQAFMFYGLAIPSGSNTPFDDGAMGNNLNNGYTVGGTSYTTASTLDEITFGPVQIHSAGTVGTNGSNIATYLTSIANANYDDGESVNHTWSATDNVILKTLYENFITIKAGSWTSVKAAVQRLYLSLYDKTFADATDNAVKDAILAAITANSNVSYSGSNGILTFTVDAYGNYPNDLNLPDGAAYVNWTGTAFEAINFPEYDNGTVLASGTSLDGYYTKSGDVYTACVPSGTADGTTTYYKKITDNTGLNIASLNKYIYPAPLYYRVLSDIRTADESKYSYYNTKTNWDDGDRENDAASHDDVLDAYGEEVTSGDGQNDIVKYTTRSIAVVKQVQYAVGRLDATVQTAESKTSLEDNAGNSIPLTHTPTGGTEVKNFPVTGILIGGQKVVDYKFEQKSAETAAFTIYDKVFDDSDVTDGDGVLTPIYLKSTTPTDKDKTHTLVFETKQATANDDPNCVTKIAVEFQNNSGEIIVGYNNALIMPGTKFYLVGTFDPYDNTGYYYSGHSSGDEYLIKKTFVQDYTTTANLVIASFKNAYNTLPDLRAPQLELGLSVNLSWNAGITQTVNIE